MSMIEKQIDDKINSLNDNGKVQFLFRLMRFCCNRLPDLNTVHLDNDEYQQVEQMVNMLKFILLGNREFLDLIKKTNLDACNTLLNQNRQLEGDINKLKEKMKLAGLDNQALVGLEKNLRLVYELSIKIGITNEILPDLENRLKHCGLAAENLHELDNLRNQCESAMVELKGKIKELNEEKKQVEDLIKDKTNAV